MCTDTQALTARCGHTGGAVVVGAGARVAVRSCVFSSNEANMGAGIAAEVLTDMTLKHSSFTDNRAFKNGAGISSSGNVALTQCSFTNNSAKAQGGAVAVDTGAVLTATDCAFEGTLVCHLAATTRLLQ
jgi:predicted outer membrane repeat protein